MNKLRIEYVSKLLDIEIGKAGDKYHSESAAELAKNYLSSLKSLREEITSSPDKTYSVAKPISFIVLGYDNGERTEFYYVKKGALLRGTLFMTPDSPIGKAVYGKKEGDSFSYEIEKGDEKVSYSGRIVNIE
jgi:hypothetical protein